MIKFVRFLLGFFCLLFLSSAAPSYADADVGTDAEATVVESYLPDSCDATVMTKIKNRASAEASRDTVLSQTVIRRPDSVLEFSCFKEFLDMNRSTGASNFSENQYWAGRKVYIITDSFHQSTGSQAYTITTSALSDTSMDSALQSLVWEIVQREISADTFVGFGYENFAHNYYGGKKEVKKIESTDEEYICRDMNTIWQYAKCDGFLFDEEFSKLEPFTNIGSTTDIRYLAKRSSDNKLERCGGTGYESIDVDDAPDTVETYLHLYDWTTTTSPTPECSTTTPIKSGLKVKAVTNVETTAKGEANAETVTFDEKTCILPGCFYNNKTGICEE